MSPTSRPLAEAVAIVTGGSTGIGAATVRALASEGCSVVIDYIGDRDPADQVKLEAERLGGRAGVVEADVSTESGVEALFGACRSQFGPPNILVNNAGVNATKIHVAEMPVEQWHKTLGVNLEGPFLCSRSFVRERRGKEGLARIINVSSIHEEIVFMGFADYDASKSGLLALTRTLALEVAALNIRVNAVAPGMILTSMNEQAMEDPNVLQEKIAHIPLRRAGTPEDVAGVILFLCKPESDYITGASICVDGGLSLNTGQGA